jgi:2Fe-2S ferredoxin
MSDIKVKITDREGVIHDLEAPTDMGMNLMELCKAYELPVEGTCGGMAMCASCQCYVTSDHELPEKEMLKKTCWTKHFLWKTTVVWAVSFT